MSLKFGVEVGNTMNKLEWYEKTSDFIYDNLETFYDTYYKDVNLVKVGSKYGLEPCPLCGHGNCCRVNEFGIHCFSACDLKDSHTSAYMKYAQRRLKLPFSTIVSNIEKFTKLVFPGISKEEVEKHRVQRRIQEVMIRAENYYHKNLMESKTKFEFNGKKISPLQYMIDIRGRQMQTLIDFKFGFSSNYPDLAEDLSAAGYTEDEIKKAEVWLPEGLFVFFYKHPTTHEIMRMNTKNPFQIKNSTTNEVIQGFSTGSKFPLFSPNFSFKSNFAIVEGEHDIASLYENGCTNICCIGGNVNEEALKILSKTDQNAIIYTCFDNDEKGTEYVSFLDSIYPEKKISVVKFGKEYKDIDEYYKDKKSNPQEWPKLISEVKIMNTEKHKITKENNVWRIKNRHCELEYTINLKGEKTEKITGNARYFKDGVESDRADDIEINKYKKAKPFNFLLSDALNVYYNQGFDERTIDELADIYLFSSLISRQRLMKVLSQKIFESKNKEEQIENIRAKLEYHPLRKQLINDIYLQIEIIENVKKEYSHIRTMTITQFFDVKNNDAYFYFNSIKKEGDDLRRIPCLLTNDKKIIRLDLYDKKDKNSIILIEDKYELPVAVKTAINKDFADCSLQEEIVNDWIAGNIPEEHLEVHYILGQFESLIRLCFYTPDDETYKLLTLYCILTHFYILFGEVPYLYFTGEKGSGKSSLDAIMNTLCFNAKMTANITDAGLFRLISIEGGTVIIDEMENLTSRNKTNESTMGAVLKSGYQKSGAKVYRTDMDEGLVNNFDTFCPKIISNIFGIDDVIQDRCITVNTYRKSSGVKTLPARLYFDENVVEVKRLTSLACISALVHFQELYAIHKQCSFDTENPRLTQILTPLLSISKYADMESNERRIKNGELIDLSDKSMGTYEKALNNYYNFKMKTSKTNVEKLTPEELIKEVVPQVARELYGLVPEKDCVLTNPELHKYKGPIEYNKGEGWFELDIIHFQCFAEENTMGTKIDAYQIGRCIKTSFAHCSTQFDRKYVKLENEYLVKAYNGVERPRISCYRFYFSNYLNVEEIENAINKKI